MKLLELTVENFLGAPDGHHVLTDATTGAPESIVLFVGDAASGKTSLLEAIIAVKESVGAYGVLPERSRWLRAGTTAGCVVARWLLSAEEMRIAKIDSPVCTTTLRLGGEGPPVEHEPGLAHLFTAYSRDPGQTKLEYFHADRQLRRGLAMPPPLLDDIAHKRLTRRDDKYVGFEQVWLRLATEDGLHAMAQAAEHGVLLRGDQRDSLLPCKAAIARMCPKLRFVGVSAVEDRVMAWFERPTGERVELYQLSHSEQQGVLFAATHHLLGLDSSILLIDEPELHVHPNEQERFFAELCRLGKATQIIAASGSAGVARAAGRHVIVRLSSVR